MTEDFSGEINPIGPSLKKYRLAGLGFFVLSVLYISIALWKLPPVDSAMNWIIYSGLFIFFALVLILTPFIFRGNRLLVQILTVVYGGRSVYSLYALAEGEAFLAVPYFLPCLTLTFYLLGRAAWDWP